jgi:ABC-type transport system substrate-binding protein
LKEAAREVDTGEADLVFAYGAPPQIPSEQTERYANSTSLKKRLLVNEQGTMRMIVMNLAVPPFDDVHVRRAVNLAVDKRQLRELAGGKFYARIAGHIIPNRLEGNLLVDYDPYRTPDAGGDLGAARREMARSRYDHDHDGRCDDPVCRDVRGLTRSSDYFPEQARVIARNLAPLGIALTVDTQTRAFAIASEPANRVPMMLNVGWGPMYPNAADFFVNLFGGPSLNTSNNNWAHVGATFDQLRQWRSPVTSVPTVDTKIESCEGLIGNAQTSCWAETDQQLMETVVPIVPLAFEYDAHVVSARVTHQDFDRAMASAALDQFAVATR